MTDHTDKHHHTTHFTQKHSLRDTPYDLRESTLNATIASERSDLEKAHQHYSRYHSQAGPKHEGATDSSSHRHDHSHPQHQYHGSSSSGNEHHTTLTKEEQRLPHVQLATGNELNIEHPVDPHHDV